MNPNASEFVPGGFASSFAPPVTNETSAPPKQATTITIAAPTVNGNTTSNSATSNAEDWESIATNPIPPTPSPSPAKPPSEEPKPKPTSEKSEVKEDPKPKKEPVPPADPDDEDAGEIIEVEESEDQREHLNVVFIGHVDAGKSTISGQILFLTGMVDQRTIEKYEREAKAAHRESWFLAYIMDTNEEERAKGKTVEVGRAFFETAAKRYTILDAPGHKTYVPNMIGGASQADVGILVISARKGEFDSGFNKGGQTREHAMLAKTLGIKYLLVVINKMDDPTVAWSQERFNEIVGQLSTFLKQVGWVGDIPYIPISGIKGYNIKDPAPKSECPWYTGPTLLGALDALKTLERSSDAPLRIPIIDKLKERGTTMALGKVEAGSISKGDQLIVVPNKIPVEVLGIMINETTSVKTARSGENIKVMLKGVEEENLHKGFVLCSPKSPVPCQTRFEAQLVIVELLPHKSIFTAGYTAVLHLHAVAEECTILVLLAQLDKKSGKVLKKKPMFVKAGDAVRCVIECSQPVCVEEFGNIPQLGRFTLRDEGKTIAIGKVTSLGPKKKSTN